MKLALILAVLVPGSALAGTSFDYTGNSDVYIDALGGAALAGKGATPWTSTVESLGWGYRFPSSGLYVNGFVRSREPSQIEVGANTTAARLTLSGTGYGAGLGWRGDGWRLEAGELEDDLNYTAVNGTSLLPLPAQPSSSGGYSLRGGYARLGLDLIQWQHVVIQADAQIEALHADGASNTYDLPQQQYVARAGISLHATDINTVIPAAVVITVLALAALSKHGVRPGSFHFGSHSEGNDCDKAKKEDCKR